MRIERRAEWSMTRTTGCSLMLNSQETTSSIEGKKEGGQRSALGRHQGGQYLYEHVMNLEESEDEDYEAAATQRSTRLSIQFLMRKWRMTHPCNTCLPKTVCVL